MYDDYDEIVRHWKTDDRGWDAAEIEKRKARYGTKTRSESMLDLRAAARTPPHLRRRKQNQWKSI